jgi:hypothetical protein
MPTEIKLVEGETVTVDTDYRTVYNQLLATNWQEPCEFVQSGSDPHPVTVNPTYIVYFRAV